jgi:Zn/Cd-binding protein ZinT
MIGGNKEDGFTLTCDHCGEDADEVFEEFRDAVNFKQDRANKWRAVKDFDGDWQDLCPVCNQPDIILGLKAR